MNKPPLGGNKHFLCVLFLKWVPLLHSKYLKKVYFNSRCFYRYILGDRVSFILNSKLILRNWTILVVNMFQHDFVLPLFDAKKQISAHVTFSSSLKYISNKQQMCIIRYERSFYFPDKSHYYLQFFSVITGRPIILANT